MKWNVLVTTAKGTFQVSYHGYKTKREAQTIADCFKRNVETKKVEVVKQ